VIMEASAWARSTARTVYEEGSVIQNKGKIVAYE
jgi:hypothetical protein